MNKTVVNEMLSVAVETAIEAGGLLMGSAFGTVAEKSSANDLVTDMDIASEALICERLLTSRPLDGVLGGRGARPLAWRDLHSGEWTGGSMRHAAAVDCSDVRSAACTGCLRLRAAPSEPPAPGSGARRTT